MSFRYDFVNTATKRAACEQGATFRKIFLFLQDDGVTPEPIPNGTTFRMQVRKTPSTTPIASLTSSPAAGITVRNSLGEVEVVIASTATAVFSPDEYLYDLEAVYPSGDVVREYEGRFQVTAEITK